MCIWASGFFFGFGMMWIVLKLTRPTESADWVLPVFAFILFILMLILDKLFQKAKKEEKLEMSH